MVRLTDTERQTLESFVRTFPPLRLALQLRDIVNWVTNKLVTLIKYVLVRIWNLFVLLTSVSFGHLAKLINSVQHKYQRLDRRDQKLIKQHLKPALPHSKNPIKRFFTQQGGLILGLMLYLFVYYVLIKHHNYATVTIAALLLVPYMLIVDNSHNLRSILMLSLPIMFTNRGRALIYCTILAVTLTGPLANIQWNTSEIHSSLNCTKKFLILKTDSYIEANVIEGVVRLEDVIYKLVDDIKNFARKLGEKLRSIVNLALDVERYIARALQKLKEIVNVCNASTDGIYSNCTKTFVFAYEDCRYQLTSTFDFLCEIVRPLIGTCSLVKLPDLLCAVPQVVSDFLNKTIGIKLRQWIQIIENELYVEVDIDHSYSFNGTKSKSYGKVAREIKFDMAAKFWYVHLLARVFNLLTLILVCWILITATYYHMNYLTDVKYDNMYIDRYLTELDEIRAKKIEKRASSQSQNEPEQEEHEGLEDDLEQSTSKAEAIEEARRLSSKIRRQELLFPLPGGQRRKYMGPFSLSLNEEERHKLCVATIVWAIIVSYAFFFVLMDFSLFSLIEEISGLLREILFESDLPVVKVESNSGDRAVKYNRTYLTYLRNLRKSEPIQRNSNSLGRFSLATEYRQLMDSIERRLPEDVDILNSLEQCLPIARVPNYWLYKKLAYLSSITFVCVIFETYAMRSRHCIANLFFPRQAKKRAIWLYQKLLGERSKYEELEAEGRQEKADSNRQQQNAANLGHQAVAIDYGLKLLAKNIKR